MPSKKVSQEDLKTVARYQASRFLDQDNVTSVGVGFKSKNNKMTNELCIQFTVEKKIALESLESEGVVELPKHFEINGIKVPTDVIKRTYESSARAANTIEQANRKTRMNPICPGASIGHPEISAGTAGCVVYGAKNGQEYILSNWHVLHGSYGRIGDPIVQPGPYDDNRVEANIVGKLVKSHLGLAGDCAIASVNERDLNPQILDLNVPVTKLAEPELGDKVVKSGRTTSVTYGIVSRVHVTVKLDYGEVGVHRIGCFEYVPDEENPPANGEVSMGGDSGSAVMLVENGKSSETILGVHFAGETGYAPEHGLACYASSVFKKLQVSPVVTTTEKKEGIHGPGFDPYFLEIKCALPSPVNSAVSRTLLKHRNEKVFDYTHFSLVLDKKRKFAPWVAWNIDGANIKKIKRKGIKFIKDPKLPSKAQIGNELYKNNPLDRGHIARRADLCWGTLSEAKKANKDSFFFTNMAPQHERFNQSSKAGIWGEIENEVFAGANIQNLRVSVYGGPILNEDDPLYRNVQIPKEFWKVICYVDEDIRELAYHAFVLTQADLISGIEGLGLDEFDVYKVPIQEITQRTGFVFKALEAAVPETLGEPEIRKIESVEDIL